MSHLAARFLDAVERWHAQRVPRSTPRPVKWATNQGSQCVTTRKARP